MNDKRVTAAEVSGQKTNNKATAAGRRKLQAIPYDQISPPKDADYVIKQLIDRGALAEIFGEPNSGKTFLATDLALHVAAGIAWMGHRVRGGLVLYVAAEGGSSALKRIAAWRMEHAQLGDELPFVLIPESVVLSAPADIIDLIDIVRAYESNHGPVRLIVIDTLSRSIPGYNENSPEDMTAAIRVLDGLRAETGAAVLVVHHSGKDKTRGSRGHSSLLGAVDTEIEVADDGAGLRTLRPTKKRDHELGLGLSFRLRIVELGIDADGDAITTCIIAPTDERPVLPARALGKWQAEVMRCFKDNGNGGISGPDLRKHLRDAGIPKQRVTEALNSLVEQGVLNDSMGIYTTNTH